MVRLQFARGLAQAPANEVREPSDRFEDFGFGLCGLRQPCEYPAIGGKTNLRFQAVSGSAAFDAAGRLAGMAQLQPAMTSGTTASTPQASIVSADAIRRLAAVAEYFHRTEPHSPVAYLVQRAVRWGEMPLEAWLQEVIHDEGVLGQVRETLGLKEAGDNA